MTEMVEMKVLTLNRRLALQIKKEFHWNPIQILTNEEVVILGWVDGVAIDGKDTFYNYILIEHKGDYRFLSVEKGVDLKELVKKPIKQIFV